MKVDIFNTDRKYQIIYADPPWSFRTWSGKGKERSADRHYECMKKKDIQNLPISELCEDDCVLFLWGLRSPALRKAWS